MQVLKKNICINKTSDDNYIDIEDNVDDCLFIQVNIKGKNNKILIHGKNKGTGKLVINLNASNSTIKISNICISKILSISILPSGGGVPSSNCSVEISNNCIFNGATSFVLAENNNSIRIGNNCLFANNISIKTSDSHYIYDLLTNERINPAKDVIIGSNVWLCENVNILKGSIISNDSVVGSNSLVVGEFKEPHIILGGIPAKKIRSNIYWRISNK